MLPIWSLINKRSRGKILKLKIQNYDFQVFNQIFSLTNELIEKFALCFWNADSWVILLFQKFNKLFLLSLILLYSRTKHFIIKKLLEFGPAPSRLKKSPMLQLSGQLLKSSKLKSFSESSFPKGEFLLKLFVFPLSSERKKFSSRL